MLHVITNIFLSLTYLEVTYSQSKNTRKSPWLINFHIKCLSKCIYPLVCSIGVQILDQTSEEWHILGPDRGETSRRLHPGKRGAAGE